MEAPRDIVLVHIFCDLTAHLKVMWSATHLATFSFKVQREPGTNFYTWMTVAPPAGLTMGLHIKDKHTNHHATQMPIIKQLSNKITFKTIIF